MLIDKKIGWIGLLLCCIATVANAREYVNLDDRDLHSKAWHRRADVLSAACIYRSVDQYGDSVTLSGKVYIPRTGRAKRILLCPHYTITANSECPSECHPAEAYLAGPDYVMVMPDYLGYGITSERVHPYLDVRLTARHTVDMLRAVQQFLTAVDRQTISDSIYIVGFSQGGAVAVGAMQQIEREGVCPVKKCFASSGPYDMAVTFDLCVERDYVGMAFVIPAFEFGTAEAYGIAIHTDTLFTPWMLRRYEYVLSKRHGVIACGMYLGRGKLSKYLTPAGMDKSRGEAKALYSGYLRSSLVHIYGGDTIFSDWCPHAPMYLMHSTTDDLVNYECGANLKTMLEHNGCNNVEYDFGDYGGHISSLFRFLKQMKKML